MFRTAIWSAVSTIGQAAENKVSIKLQLEKGREVIKDRGWIPAGEYVVPGESRTAYISLSHAEEAIPQLQQLLEDAQHGKFNILFVYDLNRFRNLMLQVFEVLCDYNIQIYNYDDPIQIVEPKQYTHERKNAARLNIKLHDIISSSEVNTLQKHYREKMPSRIKDKKLHAGLGLPPYGYRKPPLHRFDPDAVLEIVPEEKRVLIMMKDWFLTEGCSLTEIAARLNHLKIPPSREGKWWYSIVRYMLGNPFYAGIVLFGITRSLRDKRKRTTTRIKGDNPTTATGLHETIWDLGTHKRLLDEIERRAKAQPGIAIRPFSRLLRCYCSATMWAQVTPAGQYWRCSTGENKHTYINNNKAVDLVTKAIIDSVKDRDEQQPQQIEDKRADLETEIRELKAKQTRWMDLYEDGTLDKPTLNKRISDIQARLKRAQDKLDNQQAEVARRQSLQVEFKVFAQGIDQLPKYIKKADAARVNATLHRYIECVTITKKHDIKIKWR